MVPGAPSVTTAGPAKAAPSANAPTFMEAAVVKIWPSRADGVQRWRAANCDERPGPSTSPPSAIRPSAAGTVAASGQLSITSPIAPIAQSITRSGRQRVCRRTSSSAPMPEPAANAAHM